MSKTISIDELAKAVADAYRLDIEGIHESALIAADECAADCLESIKADSPEASGEYKKGWVKRKSKQGSYLYNKNKPYLEMPLEHGHVIARGKNKGKRVPPKPHIYMNRDKYMEQFYEKCVKIVAEGVRLNKEK